MGGKGSLGRRKGAGRHVVGTEGSSFGLPVGLEPQAGGGGQPRPPCGGGAGGEGGNVGPQPPPHRRVQPPLPAPGGRPTTDDRATERRTPSGPPCRGGGLSGSTRLLKPQVTSQRPKEPSFVPETGQRLGFKTADFRCCIVSINPLNFKSFEEVELRGRVGEFKTTSLRVGARTWRPQARKPACGPCFGSSTLPRRRLRRGSPPGPGLHNVGQCGHRGQAPAEETEVRPQPPPPPDSKTSSNFMARAFWKQTLVWC